MFHVQHKNNGPHISHRNKGSTSDRHEQILTPILDMSPTTDRIVDQRKLRKAKSQVSVTSYSMIQSSNHKTKTKVYCINCYFINMIGKERGRKYITLFFMAYLFDKWKLYYCQHLTSSSLSHIKLTFKLIFIH